MNKRGRHATRIDRLDSLISISRSHPVQGSRLEAAECFSAPLCIEVAIMKVMLTTAVLALSTIPMLAQAGEHGVSRPDPTPITVPEDQEQPQRRPVPVSNPDANIVTTTNAAQDDASAYHPYHPGAAPYASTLSTRPAAQPLLAEHDVDGDIVTSVPQREGEMAEGTLLKVRMNETLSTRSTLRGSPFSATLIEDVQRDGRVVIPAGSVLDGSITEVHGGKRIAGRAAIHLEPRRVTLPDGTYYMLHAQVTDTSQDNAVKVDREGTVLRRDHPEEMLAILSLSTGSGAVAGAMIGGGVGAVVGAGLGAGVSTILWLKEDRQAALPKNTALVFSLTTPMMIRPLQDGAHLRP